MPVLHAILETALYVDDLTRAAQFYRDVLGLAPLIEDTRIIAFNVGGRSVLLLFERGGSTEPTLMPDDRGTIPPHDGSGPIHFAFAVGADDLPAWEARLAAHGVAIEGRSRWVRGGSSLYFRDPDGHLVELATPGLWSIY